jgi:hypothetical protein
MLPVRLAVLLLLALALGTVSIARLRAAPATEVIHGAAEKHERSQTTLPFQPLEEVGCIHQSISQHVIFAIRCRRLYRHHSPHPLSQTSLAAAAGSRAGVC